MHNIDGFEEVADNERGTFFGEGFPGGDDVVELPVAPQLHDRVEVVLVAEEPVVLDDVGVVQEVLDLQLPDELHQQVVLQDLLLRHHLQSDDHPRPVLTRQEHVPELALAQPPDYPETFLAGPAFLRRFEAVGGFVLVAEEGGEGLLAAVGAQLLREGNIVAAARVAAPEEALLRQPPPDDVPGDIFLEVGAGVFLARVVLLRPDGDVRRRHVGGSLPVALELLLRAVAGHQDLFVGDEVLQFVAGTGVRGRLLGGAHDQTAAWLDVVIALPLVGRHEVTLAHVRL
jgi:hypothetical protein